MAHPGQHQAVHTQPGMDNPGYYGQYPPPGAHQSHHTTVIVNQPERRNQVRNWSSGVCDCCDDIGICLCGTFCSFCLAMQVSSDMDETMCLPCCVPNAVLALRVKMRTQESIQGTICNDCLVLTFCGNCALCQLAREVKMVRTRR